MIIDNDDEPFIVRDSRDLLRKIVSESTPETPVTLKELVTDLLDVTPATNLTDIDGDSIPDIIESVIGTNSYSNDTDGDYLSDDFEIYNDLDPCNADSNDDGFCDTYEVDTNYDGIPDGMHIDSDNDGILNGWDNDNDGDGVNDAYDVSPYAYSQVRDEFSIQVNTNSMPLFVEFQIVPQDPIHLRYLYKTWDWPDTDTESTMRDLDNSKRDILLIPFLEITTDILPNETDLLEQGITLTSSGMRIRLSPVMDCGEIVAFGGTVYYSDFVSSDVTFQTRLVWSVHGYSDYVPNAFRFWDNDKCLTIGSGGIASVSATESSLGALQLCRISSDEIAVRLVNGDYLSVSDNGTLFFNSPTIGDRETFKQHTFWGNNFLEDYLGNYIGLDGNDNLISTPDIMSMSSFMIEDLTPRTNLIELVSYNEPFRLTGLKISESISSDIGLFYNSTNVNMTIGASLLSDYYFLKNTTTSVADMSTLLMENNITVDSQVASFQSQFQAFTSLGNDMIPTVLDSVAPNLILPITILIEDESRIVDLSDISFNAEGVCDVSLVSFAPSIIKTLKMNYYNSTSYQSLSSIDIIDEITRWDLDEELTYWIVTMTFLWFYGEQCAPKINGIDQQKSGNIASDLVTVSQNVGQWVMVGIEVFLDLGEIPRAFREIKYFFDGLSKGGRAFRESMKVAQMGKVASTVGKASSWLNRICSFDGIIEIIVGAIALGLTIWAAWEIAEAIGGSGGQEYGAIWGVVTFLWDVIIGPMFAAWATIFTFGLAGIFLLVDEILGWAGVDNPGVNEAIKEFFIGIIFGSPNQVVSMWPTSQILDIDPTIVDYEDNGLTAGDGIWVTCELLGRVSAFGFWLKTYLSASTNKPHFWINTGDILHLYYQSINPAVQISASEEYYPYWPLSYELTQQGFALQTDPAWNQTTWLQSQYTPAPIAMVNYPVTLGLVSTYHMWSVWYHEWFFGAFDCTHYDAKDGIEPSYSSAYNPFLAQIYFDVFPATFNDFLSWREITPNDFDGDNINNTIEIETGITSMWSYDSDGDGLNDKYETDIGTNPADIDTDHDKLNDKFEVMYGTDPCTTDSDDDGLSDYLEVTGWVIDFNYMGNSSLPFSIHVTSNPLCNESDGDGLSDALEYYRFLNPMSADTNGDRIEDGQLETTRYTSTATFERSIDIVGNGEAWDGNPTDILTRDLEGITVDENGIVYIVYHGSSAYYDEIRKFYPNLTEVSVPFTSYFRDSMGTEIDGAVWHLEVDDANDWLYTWNYRWDHEMILVRYDLDGSVENPGTFTPIDFGYVPPSNPAPDLTVSESYDKYDIDLDAAGNIYISYYQYIDQASHDEGAACIMKYDSTGGHIANLSDFRGASYVPNEFDNPIAIAVDKINGFIYVADEGDHYGVNRVAKLRIADGALITNLPGNFVTLTDIDVDNDGCVYILGNSTEGPCVRKFDSSGFEDKNFTLYGSESVNFTKPTSLTVDNDKNIYIMDTLQDSSWPSLSRLWKFNQSFTDASHGIPDTNPDWDEDGLTNFQEVTGWDIYVEFSATTKITFTVTSDPLVNDTDQDGLSDFLEFTLGSNPNSLDTDLDGVSDHEEWWMETHPGEVYIPPTISPYVTPTATIPTSLAPSSGMNLTLWDSDGDNLRDGLELDFGSDPTSPDSDDDTLSDFIEFQYNSNPNSNDSDGDGASDALEYQYNSSLLNQDSDGDLSMDGVEYTLNTDPHEVDSDGDGIFDGIEWFIGTNALSNDTDGDGATDDLEISYWLDALNNDTDGDGILDGIELDWGSSPWILDSDWDGVPDNEDPDTFTSWEGPVVLVYDEEEDNNTILFAEKLQEYVDVTIVSVNDLTSLYSESPYVVLVGRPDATSYSAAGLAYDLLSDTGSVLTEMMEPDSHEITTRYGVWTNPQTVIMLSQAYPADVYTVLQIFRGRNITILPDMAKLEYLNPVINDNSTYQYSFMMNEIDTFKMTDSMILINLNGLARPLLEVHRYNVSTTPQILSTATGLGADEVSLGYYLDVSITLYDTTSDVFDSALIQIFYRESDLDLSGNGQLGDIGDINETSLSVYQFDEVTGQWIKLTEELSWVIGIGQNTTNVQIFGENYGGYVWIQTTELSLFAIAGQTIHFGFGLTETIILIAILGTVGIVTIVLVHRWRKRRVEGKQIDLLSSLQGCFGWI
ncbi:MAG: hypothetical protein ACW98Y_12285 [Candidatus Thorarchaeota archaeon]